jgi:hypothetical protein
LGSFDDDRTPPFHRFPVGIVQAVQRLIGNGDIEYSFGAGPDKIPHWRPPGIGGSCDLGWWRSPFILKLHEQHI